MLEQGLPSVWTSLLSWFTPAVFFVLLNLVIGTIALTSKPRSSSSSTPAPSAGDYARANTLVRAPSLVLDRLRSFNLSQYVHHHHHDYDNNLPTDNTTLPLAAGADTPAAANGNGNALTRAPSLVLNRLRSFGLSRFVSGEFSAETVVHVEPDVVLDSASQVEEHENYNEHHIERTQSDAKPPLPKLLVRMKKSASDKSAFSHFEEAEIPKQQTIEEEDGEVDAKADDFINKFKNQLRLQRLDSIMRYKEMLTRGSASN